MQKVTSVEAYIASAPKAIQGKLKNIRQTIKKAAPQAEEKISYSMPYYGYQGRLVYFAYFKDHISFFAMPPIPPEYAKKLKVTGKATIQFSLDEKIPLALIARLVKEGVKRNEQRNGKKRTVTCSRGHVFSKSSDCPVCPKCWPGYYQKKSTGEFGDISAPAQRALMNAKITTLKQVAKHSEAELLELHGMGPKAIGILKKLLKAESLEFKKSR